MPKVVKLYRNTNVIRHFISVSLCLCGCVCSYNHGELLFIFSVWWWWRFFLFDHIVYYVHTHTIHLPLPNWMPDTFPLDDQIHRGFLLHLTSTHIFIREKKFTEWKAWLSHVRWHFYTHPTAYPMCFIVVVQAPSPPQQRRPPSPKTIKLILYRLRLSFSSQTFILPLQRVSLLFIMSLLLREYM